MHNQFKAQATAIIIAIVALIIAAGSAYLILQNRSQKLAVETTTTISTITTEEPTTTKTTAINLNNWKIFRDEDLGFEIQYPEGTKMFYTFEGTNNPDISPSSTITFMFPFVPDNPGLTRKQLDIDVNNEYKKPCNYNKNPSLPPITINGITFKRFDVSGDFVGIENGAFATEYCAMRGNKPFRIITQLGYKKYVGSPFDKEKESEIFTQVLSTLKFLK